MQHVCEHVAQGGPTCRALQCRSYALCTRFSLARTAACAYSVLLHLQVPCLACAQRHGAHQQETHHLQGVIRRRHMALPRVRTRRNVHERSAASGSGHAWS